MASFGDELKRERELRDISLKEISEGTKISIRFLEGLEQNNFDILPGGVFNRGFIRAYARFIGIDGEEMVNAYLHELALREQRRAVEGRAEAPRPAAPPLPSPAAPKTPARFAVRRGPGYLEGIRSESLAGLRARDASAPAGGRLAVGAEGRTSAALWALVVIAFLVGSGMIALNFMQGGRREPPTDAQAQAARARQSRLARRPPAADVASETGGAAGERAKQARAAAGDGGSALDPAGADPVDTGADRSTGAAVPAPEHRLWVRATEATQVTVECAGRIVLAQELWPGLERRLECAEPVALSATNAGALEYALDGGRVTLLGGLGEQVRGAIVAPRPAADPRAPKPAPPGEPTPDAGA